MSTIWNEETRKGRKMEVGGRVLRTLNLKVWLCQQLAWSQWPSPGDWPWAVLRNPPHSCGDHETAEPDGEVGG